MFLRKLTTVTTGLLLLTSCAGLTWKSTSAPIQEVTPPFVIKTPTKKIPILMYHYIGEIPADQKNNAVRKDLTVSAENFEAQLKWLKKNGYTTPGSIMLTFDDGYDNAYSTAFPLLEKYGFRGIFAIITGKVDTAGYLSWDQISEMKQVGMEFWSHTVAHLDLRTLSDKILETELIYSKTILEEKLGVKIDGFVYPAGKYNERVVQAVKKAGYLWARTTKKGWGTLPLNSYEIPTIRIHGTTSLAQFASLLTPSQ